MSKDWILPAVIDPPETVCFQIAVPKDDMHIAAFLGALQELAYSYNWEWDGLKSGLAVARVWERQINLSSQAVRIGENCMLDCDEVEDCLETSTIINVIEGDVTNNTTLIGGNTTNIIDNSSEIITIITGGNDTNVYPALPTQSEPDELCGASHEVAREIIALVEQTVLDVGLLTLAAWLLSWLGIGGWLGTQLSLFWDYILANEIALTGVDFDVYQDQVAEALYCAELDRVTAIADLDPAIPALRRDALIKGLESATDAQVALWAFVGSLDTTADCSGFSCGWCKEFDFTIDDGGWYAGYDACRGLNVGSYSAGVGWIANYLPGAGGCPSNYKALFAHYTIAAQIVQMEITYSQDWTNGSFGNEFGPKPGSGDPIPYADATDAVLTWNGNRTATDLYIVIYPTFNIGNVGSATLKKVRIWGTGTNPFGGSNC